MPEVETKAVAKSSPLLGGLAKRDSKGSSLKSPLSAAALAPGQSVFDSKDYVQGKDNVWQLMLQKASRKASLPNATLVVLGDKKNGKTSILNKFGERIVNPTVFEYVLDYSYLPVKNRHNADKEEVLGSLNVYQWDDPAHADVLQHFYRAHGLDNTVYVLTVSLAEPWNAVKSVTNWLNVLTAQHNKIFEKMPADEQKRLKDKISAYTQLYVDPSVKKKQAASGDHKASVTTAEEKEMAAKSLSPNIPKCNLGVPLIIVGTKADSLGKKGSKGSAGSDDRFEFLTRRLRKIALEYGASLLFTSAVGTGLNTDLLLDYIHHRLYSFPLDTPAKPIVSVSSDDVNLYVPSGYDSLELIDPVASAAIAAAAATGKPAQPLPVISVGNWTENTPLEDVFENTDQKAKVGKSAEEVVAMDNGAFYRMLQVQLEKDSVRTAAAVGGLNINVHAHSSGPVGGPRASVQLPLSPNTQSTQQSKATLEKLEAMRRAAAGGGGVASVAAAALAAGNRTPTHSQSSRDLLAAVAPAGAGASGAAAAPKGEGANPQVINKQPVQGAAKDMKKTAVKAFFKSLLGNAAAGGATTPATTPGATPTTGNSALRTAARSTLEPQPPV